VLAGFGDAFHDLLRNFRFERAGGEVVMKNRGRALHHDVVDAMIDQVSTDGVVDFISKATLSLVPTPSTLETSTGST